MKDEVSAEPIGPVSTVMQYVYCIPVIGWALEGVIVDRRPKARLAGLFVLIAAPTVAVSLLGAWGAFVPLIMLGVLVVFAFDLIRQT